MYLRITIKLDFFMNILFFISILIIFLDPRFKFINKIAYALVALICIYINMVHPFFFVLLWDLYYFFLSILGAFFWHKVLIYWCSRFFTGIGSGKIAFLISRVSFFTSISLVKFFLSMAIRKILIFLPGVKNTLLFRLLIALRNVLLLLLGFSTFFMTCFERYTLLFYDFFIFKESITREKILYLCFLLFWTFLIAHILGFPRLLII